MHEAGVPARLLGEGLRSFRPLPHRLEPVREVGGVLWINDSKATNIAATTVAVLAMQRPFVLLLGGRHKGEPYTSLVRLLADRCRLVIAYGEAGPLVEQDFGRAELFGHGLDLVGLAAADEQLGVGRLALARDARDRFEPGRERELAELVEPGVEMGRAQIHADEDRGREGAVRGG